MIQIQRAILSVSDKRGLVALARGLSAHGATLLSTGGTARALREAGIEPLSVSEYTGAPEIFGGRVKTLHPKIHGGLLARPAHEEDSRQMAEHDIAPIDLVVVNLYPFEATVAREGVTTAEAIENIDIGGPTMIRAAAKNHQRVAVVVDPDDYAEVLRELDESGGALSHETRARLARKAFAHTAAYDTAISAYLASSSLAGDSAPAASPPATAAHSADGADEPATFPASLTVTWKRTQTLRYGENPHQRAAFYEEMIQPLGVRGHRPRLPAADILQGKALSYNNVLDTDAALACCLEFTAPCAVVVKHTNPCGVALADDIASAYEQARATDPTSSFGGIVAVNREVSEELAELLAETFLECVIAPGFSEAARARLAKKKNLRLLATGPWLASDSDLAWSLRSVAGGVLVQEADFTLAAARNGKVVSARAPDEAELDTLDFAWRVGKHVKSNAIVFCAGTRTLGVGAGQMSRVDAARIARDKALGDLSGSCVASDAFFPFRDGVDALAEAGARAVIQPGGSVRDEEVIAAADEHGMAMVLTGMRHFRH
ncbi:bifunctional phosphoribosylaminoimidazolecarboxamide formyltransferase/IMP cyclohydrolase [Haliangium ochraceum]|uniref:Bifunctional purine biosynthesis protein PurH n=1 Tax=Haliangium ochraceum (strain DSM 14365 / JCM 11303 / SMP-2) TaxID=502025 RepID=D0LU42_HALO1|nr:bifunctional phosphoribosylaminoimidazolecarboxamide formyltransferase/IMP cyclohydrolase [Haliangium ochraceum]ACY17406.1 phosphoribosylaminoimidazolecarboxamide formyltransferase/IMP cyclohydrolase [Haliangium ochraceum DSM 14365]